MLLMGRGHGGLWEAQNFFCPQLATTGEPSWTEICPFGSVQEFLSPNYTPSERADLTHPSIEDKQETTAITF